MQLFPPGVDCLLIVAPWYATVSACSLGTGVGHVNNCVIVMLTVTQEYTSLVSKVCPPPSLSRESLGMSLGIYGKVSCNSRLHAVSARCETKPTSTTKPNALVVKAVS